MALRSGSSSGQKDSFFFFTFSLFLFYFPFFFASNFSAQEARKLLQRALDVVPFVPCHPSSPSHHPRLLTAPPTSSPLAVVALHSLRPATIESRSTSREQFKARIIIKSSWKGHLFHWPRGSTFVYVRARQRSILRSFHLMKLPAWLHFLFSVCAGSRVLFLSLSQFLSLFIVMYRSSRTVNRNSAPALSPFHDWFILSYRSLTLLPFTTSVLRNTCLFLSLRNHGTKRSYSNISLPERITTSAYLGIKQKHTDRSAGPRQFLLRSRVYIHRCFLHLPSPILIESMFTRCLSATTPSELIRPDASIRSNWEFPWQVKRPLEIPPFTISSFVPWSPRRRNVSPYVSKFRANLIKSRACLRTKDEIADNLARTKCVYSNA